MKNTQAVIELQHCIPSHSIPVISEEDERLRGVHPTAVPEISSLQYQSVPNTYRSPSVAGTVKSLVSPYGSGFQCIDERRKAWSPAAELRRDPGFPHESQDPLVRTVLTSF